MEAVPAPEPAPLGLVERLRGVHLAMVDAVLGGDGLERVAELASEAAGGPVAIVVPRHDVAVAFPADSDAASSLGALRRYVSDRARDRPAQVPEGLTAEAAIESGGEKLGIVALFGTGAPDAPEFLHLAAVASMTDVAVEQAREEVEQNVRGSFLEDLRSRPDIDPRDIVRRAARLGLRPQSRER